MRVALAAIYVFALLGCSDIRYAILKNASGAPVTLHLSHAAEGPYPSSMVTVAVRNRGSRTIGRITALGVSSAGCEYQYELDWRPLNPDAFSFPIRAELKSDFSIIVPRRKGWLSRRSEDRDALLVVQPREIVCR